MQTDMTVGKPMKMILDFTIPVFIGNVFQQFVILTKPSDTNQRVFCLFLVIM